MNGGQTAADGRAQSAERQISDTVPAVNPAASAANGVVLFIDDHPDTLDLYDMGMAQRGYQVHTAASGDAALALLTTTAVDAVVTDLQLEGMSGIEVCTRVAHVCPDVPVLFITGHGSMDAAVAAMRAGAYDFITKPVELDALHLALARAVQHRALREEVKRLRRVVAEADVEREAVGESPEMRTLFEMIGRVAAVDASVVVTGETGTGKEVVARLLHRQSARAQGPFVAINCAALPPQLLESELFGHERGAFTDAKVRRTGLFAQGHGGTIFLDEVGTLPVDLQPKLLRALEQRVVRPVGGNAEVAFDARIVAATNEDLESAVEAGRFREDLFFRLNVIHIPIPPLRVRGNDVLLLAQQFIERFATRLGKRVGGLTTAAAEKLLAYAWPGNVRELQNCIERAVALTQYESLTVNDLPEKVRNYESSRLVVDLDHPGEFVAMAEIERRYVLRVLAAMSGNKAEAARVLGFDRKTLYRKLERYGWAGTASE